MPIKASVIKKIALLGIDNFDGSGSVRKFLTKIDKRGRLEKWSKRDKARIVICLCIGPAEAFLDSYPQLQNATYDVLCRELISRFDKQFSLTEAYTELMSIKQGEDTIENFVYRIETVASEIDHLIPELTDKSARDEYLIAAFMEGINTEIRCSLVLIEYREFETMVRAAKRLEKTYDSRRRVVDAIANGKEREFSQIRANGCGRHNHEHQGRHMSQAYHSDWCNYVHPLTSSFQYEDPTYFGQNNCHPGVTYTFNNQYGYEQPRTAYFREEETKFENYSNFGGRAGILIAVALVMMMIMFMVKLIEC